MTLFYSAFIVNYHGLVNYRICSLNQETSFTCTLSLCFPSFDIPSAYSTFFIYIFHTIPFINSLHFAFLSTRYSGLVWRSCSRKLPTHYWHIVINQSYSFCCCFCCWMRGKCFRKVPASCCCCCCCCRSCWCWRWGWQWGWDGSGMAAVPLSSVFACCELCSCVLLFLWSWFMAEFFIGGRSGWPVTIAAWSHCREPANLLDTITYRCSCCHWHAQNERYALHRYR